MPSYPQFPQPYYYDYPYIKEVVQLSEAKRGFILLLKRWVVERSIAWIVRANPQNQPKHKL